MWCDGLMQQQQQQRLLSAPCSLCTALQLPRCSAQQPAAQQQQQQGHAASGAAIMVVTPRRQNWEALCSDSLHSQQSTSRAPRCSADTALLHSTLAVSRRSHRADALFSVTLLWLYSAELLQVEYH